MKNVRIWIAITQLVVAERPNQYGKYSKPDISKYQPQHQYSWIFIGMPIISAFGGVNHISITNKGKKDKVVKYWK